MSEAPTPTPDDQPPPAWERLAAFAVAVLLVVGVVVWRDRLSADFWPPDASRVGPNILASLIQWAVLLLVAALLWPPTRRRIRRFVTGHTAPLHDRLAAIERRHADGHDELRRHLEHIIEHHPDIPPLDRPDV